MAPTPRRRTRALAETSELEGFVIGYLWKHGPSTAYAIRKELLASPTAHWSGSAGAIYPLLEKLRARGTVRGRSIRQGEREGQSYTLTAAGRRELLAWIGPPLGAESVSITPDPLRTRVLFLGALTPRGREAFLRCAEAALHDHLAELESLRTEDAYDEGAVRGAILVVRARLAWLKALRRIRGRAKRVRLGLEA